MSETVDRPLRVRHQNPLRQLQVVRAESLTPRLRRIVLGGAALQGFVSAAADDHVKLFLPQPDAHAAAVARDYTPRRYDEAAGELTIDFVLHGDGPASAWAAQAMPGQTIAIGGPRGSFLAPFDAESLLLAGDETALPAIARRLEELEPGARAVAVIEVEDDAEQLMLPSAGSTRLIWLHRNGAPAGAPDRLLPAVRALDLPSGGLHVWLAGEIGVVRQLRSRFIEDRGLPRSRVRAAGYWRHGASGAHERIED